MANGLKIFCIILTLCGCFGSEIFESCVPKETRFPSKNYWLDHYNMTVDVHGWTKFVPYRSSLVYEDVPLGDLDINMWSNKVHVYTHVASLHEAGKEILPVKLDHTMLMNFYSGHSILVHMIDPIKNKVTHVQLGYHSKRYFFVLEANTFVFLEFEKHLDEKMALIGTTILRSRKSGTLDFADLPRLVKHLPTHKDQLSAVLDKYFSD